MSPSPQLSHHHMLHSHQVPLWSERSTYSLPECGKDAEMTPRHSAGIEWIHTWFSMRARLPPWITAQGYLVFRKLVIVVSVLRMVAIHFPGTVSQFYEYTIPKTFFVDFLHFSLCVSEEAQTLKYTLYIVRLQKMELEVKSHMLTWPNYHLNRSNSKPFSLWQS